MSTPQHVLDDFASKPPSSALGELNAPTSLGADGWSTDIQSLQETFATHEGAQWTVGYAAVTR